MLQGTEVRYQRLEKLALALVSTARKLKPYFQSHQVVIRTDTLIKQIFHKPNLTGRMVAWAIELSKFGLIYEQRKAIKAQALTDFIVEMTQTEDEQPI